MDDKQTSFDSSTIESDDDLNSFSPLYSEVCLCMLTFRFVVLFLLQYLTFKYIISQRELVHLMDDSPAPPICFEDCVYMDSAEQAVKGDQCNEWAQPFDSDLLKSPDTLVNPNTVLEHHLSGSREPHTSEKPNCVDDASLPIPSNRVRISIEGSLDGASLSTEFLNRSISLPLSKSIAMEFDEDGQRHSFCSEISIRINTIAYALRQIEMSRDELSLQDRKNVMQMLTKDMMENVLHDRIGADVASNTIHCAAVVSFLVHCILYG